MSRHSRKTGSSETLDTTTDIASLKQRYYTLKDLQNLTGCHYRTLLKHIESGKLITYRGPSKWEHRVSLDEVRKYLGYDIDEKLYLKYNGQKFPHSAYLYYLLIDTIFDIDDMHERLELYRLVCPDQSCLSSMWEALIRSAPKPVADAMMSKRAMYKKRGYNRWLKSLGIEQLFDDVHYPCMGILFDTSNRRIVLEVLLGGRVSLEEIRDFLHKRHSAYYTIDQLKFFQFNFYNVMDFTCTDYFAFLSYIPDPKEVLLKRRGWDSPDLAKMQVGVPVRSDFESGLHEIAEQARIKAMEVASSSSVDPQSFRIFSDVYLKALDRDIKWKSKVADERSEALHHAENRTGTVEIEKVRQDRVLYEDLIQDEFDDDGDIREGIVKAG